MNFIDQLTQHQRDVYAAFAEGRTLVYLDDGQKYKGSSITPKIADELRIDHPIKLGATIAFNRMNGPINEGLVGGVAKIDGNTVRVSSWDAMHTIDIASGEYFIQVLDENGRWNTPPFWKTVPHINAEAIHLFLAGHKMQRRARAIDGMTDCGPWEDATRPTFHELNEYRVKPEFDCKVGDRVVITENRLSWNAFPIGGQATITRLPDEPSGPFQVEGPILRDGKALEIFQEVGRDQFVVLN